MKKIITVFLVLAVSAMSAFAQEKEDKQIFNHLAVGPTIGFDGLGIELATTITPYLQLRLGASIEVPPSITIQGKNISALPETIDINDDQRPFRNVASIKGSFNGGLPSGKLLLDVYPGKNTGFHFTLGVLYCQPQLLGLDVDLSKTLKPEEYASYYIQLQEGNLDSRISSDKNGHIHAAIVSNVIRPYVGLGFGRQIRPDSRVSVSFDLGAVYTGGLKVASYDYTLKEEGRQVLITSEMIDNQDKGVIDILSKVPVLPMMKLNVMIRIF